jgi:asparagine synthase (glutamine-hydrolysing)
LAGKCLEKLINFKLKHEGLWSRYVKKNITLWIKGYFYSHTIDEIIDKFLTIKKNEVSSYVKSIDGHFAIIVKRHDLTFLVVDKIRSTPLFFTKIQNEFYVDYDPKNLVKLNNFDNTINQNGKLELTMSGFIIGNKTIYKNLNSLKAGELVILKDNTYEYLQYYRYHGEITNKIFSECLEELTDVTLNIFRKMLKQIGNRQIVIPLSAGNDSRLVASILKHLGVKNVKCYSYGTTGNFEAKIAKIISQKLGYEWKFVPLSHKSEKKYYVSKDYEDYLNYSETYCSVPYIQSLSTIKYLKDMNWIDQDSVFINGNSGDFISGGHIAIKHEVNNEILSVKSRKENILIQLIEKHFSLWGYLKTDLNIKKLKKNLWNEIVKGCGELQTKMNDHLFYEYSELIDRQSKYVVTLQKVYEYHNYEWRLPLWDDEYLYYWQKIPLDYKLKQKLYLEMLIKNNFGNVWGDDIPVNKKMITPKWIIPLRFIFKIPFSLFGKKGKDAWKQFDINFFLYFRDITHMMDTQNYFKIIRDIFKKPRNHVSWQTQDYLNKNN